MAPGPSSDIFRGPCAPILSFVFPIILMILIKAVRSDCKHFFFRLEKTELDYDTGIFMRLWNMKNFVSAVLSTKIQL